MNTPNYHLLQAWLRTLCHLFVAVSLLAFGGWAQAAKGSKPPGGTTTTPAKFSYYATGDVTGAVGGVAPAKTVAIPPAYPSYVLMGGGPDVDEAFRWMIEKAGITLSSGGRLVVIRTTGNGDYNPYIYYSDKKNSTLAADIVDGWVGGASMGLTSVETLVLPDRAAADDPIVNAIVAQANALWIAGGDQSTYINNWKDSKLEASLNQLMANNVPIGGTSAGLAVMGGFDYSALYASATSPLALADPFYTDITFDPSPLSTSGGFIAPEPFKNVIFDSHLDSRDRLGRLVAFVSRLIAPYSSRKELLGCEGGVLGNATARGVGMGVEAALLVDAARGRGYQARMVTNVSTTSESAAYIVNVSMGPTQCAPGQTLETPASSVNVYKFKAIPGAKASQVTPVNFQDLLQGLGTLNTYYTAGGTLYPNASY